MLQDSVAPIAAFWTGTAIVAADQVGAGGTDITILGVLVSVLAAVWKLLSIIGTRMAKSIEESTAQTRILIEEMRRTGEAKKQLVHEVRQLTNQQQQMVEMFRGSGCSRLNGEKQT